MSARCAAEAGCSGAATAAACPAGAYAAGSRAAIRVSRAAHALDAHRRRVAAASAAATSAAAANAAAVAKDAAAAAAAAAAGCAGAATASAATATAAAAATVTASATSAVAAPDSAARLAELGAALSEAEAELAAARAPGAFHGPAADSRLGELLLDVLPLACAAGGCALDLRQARFLCGATFREGDKGATADMIASSLRLQAPWLAAARAAPCEEGEFPAGGGTVRRSTQLVRTAFAGDERRVRELVAGGAAPGPAFRRPPAAAAGGAHSPPQQPPPAPPPLRTSALHWALEGTPDLAGSGRERGAEARPRRERLCLLLLELDPAGEAAGLARGGDGVTPLMLACGKGLPRVVRALLRRGVSQEPQCAALRRAALHYAVRDARGSLALLLAAPDAHYALALEDARGDTPLALATRLGMLDAAAALRAHADGGSAGPSRCALARVLEVRHVALPRGIGDGGSGGGGGGGAIAAGEGATARALGCAACGAAFGEAAVAAHRAHFRSDWHRANLKRRLRAAPPLGEAEFEALAPAAREALLAPEE